jgi:hypothetical protein
VVPQVGVGTSQALVRLRGELLDRHRDARSALRRPGLRTADALTVRQVLKLRSLKKTK